MELEGSNVIVLDLETLHSSADCRYCLKGQGEHVTVDDDPPMWCQNVFTPAGMQRSFERLGWNDHAALGISIGCFFSYHDMRYHFFDAPTLAMTMRQILDEQPVIVSWNGLSFDSQVMAAVYRQQMDMRDENAVTLPWNALWTQGYDILAKCWEVSPDRKYEKGLNSLGAVSVANGYGAKALDGALAPQLWRRGEYARVIEYNVSDVEMTRRIFEKILTNAGVILRGDGKPITLPVPTIPQRKEATDAPPPGLSVSL